MAAGEERGKVVVSERAGPECEGRKACHQNAAEVLLPTPTASRSATSTPHPPPSNE